MYVKTITKKYRQGGKRYLKPKRKKARRKKQSGGVKELMAPGASILPEGFKQSAGEQLRSGLQNAGMDLKGGLQSGKIGFAGAANLLGKGAEKLISKGSATASDDFRTDKKQRAGAAVGGALSGAGKGADIGKKFGPWGAVIGGALGAIGGAVKSRVGQEKERKAKVRGLRESQNAAMRASANQPDAFAAKAGTGFNTATSSTKAYDQSSRAQKGGVRKLPGGKMSSLPGGAVEFTGKTHEQGGIMLDKRTEVETGETMDKVKMKKEGGQAKDYIFSDYLKLGGKTFATRHKEMLAGGAKQQDIQELAKLQEKKANRKPKVMRHGGEHHDADGNPTNADGVRIASSPEEQEALEAELNNNMSEADIEAANVEREKIIAENEAAREAREAAGGVEERDEESGQRIYGGNEEENISNWLSTMEGDMANLPEEHRTFDFEQYKDEEGNFDPSKFNTKEEKSKFRTWYNELPDDLVSGKLSAKNDEGDLIFGEQWNTRKLLQRPETPEPLEYQHVDIEGKPEGSGGTGKSFKKRDVPIGALLAGAGQLIPPAYALLKKPKTVPGYAPQAYAKPQLPRVNYNAERASNASDVRATMASIENNAAGPAGMVSMIAAMGKKRQGDLQIATAESRANQQLAAEEAKLGQQTSEFNIGQDAQAQSFNRTLAREQIKDRREEVMGALDAAADRIAGITGDVLDYRATERLGAATAGTTGVLLREHLRQQFPNKSDEDIAALAASMEANMPKGGSGGDPDAKKNAKLAKKKARKDFRKKKKAIRRGEEEPPVEQRRGGYIKGRRRIKSRR